MGKESFLIEGFDSKKIWQLYISLMDFRNNIFNPINESEDKITQDINPKYG